MAKADLTVSAREVVGKGGARSLRRAGMVPAVVYGKGFEPCTVTVSPKELTKAISGEAGWNTLLTLRGAEGVEGRVVILKDMQLDPIRREATHVDFQAIDLKKKVNVMVPVHPVGKAEGEKLGGNLQVIRHELEVVCLPTAIPAAIEIDVTAMVIGDVFHIDDVVFADGVEAAPHEANFTIITVTGRKADADEEGEESEGEEDTEE